MGVSNMLGERLQELRKDKGLTQKELADKLGFSERTIGAYEIGKSKPSYNRLIQLCKFFNVSVEYLLEIIDEPVAYTKNDKVLTLNLNNLSKCEIEEIKDFVYFIHLKHKGYFNK